MGNLIGAIKIYNYFDLILTFDDTKKRKDTGIPFKKALKILKLKHEEVLVVGDWYERDIIGARKAGIKSVLVKNGKVGKILTIV